MAIKKLSFRNAAKYMIGAIALAAAILAGIGHKQGWFGKAAKKGKELSDDLSKTGKILKKTNIEPMVRLLIVSLNLIL